MTFWRPAGCRLACVLALLCAGQLAALPADRAITQYVHRAWTVEQGLPHGTVRAEWYYSKMTGETRRIFVYTPPGYDTSGQRYPVLYLQHGYGEDEAGWSDQGHENFILDNLIAAHKAKPMIIVNENGLTGVHFVPRPPPIQPTADKRPSTSNKCLRGSG